MSDGHDWAAGTWEGSRREMIRRNLRLAPAERLEMLGSLREFSDVVREIPTVRYGAPAPELALAGCRPAPLASYLKALGVLRLVSEQEEGDPEARGRWGEDGFVLSTGLDRQGLLDFFLTKYRPTPILAPWNGGSGFYPDKMAMKKEREGPVPLGVDPMRTSQADRFSDLRRTIAEIQDVLQAMGIATEAEKERKEELLVRLRAELNDTALTWFDAAILLADEPRFPPLLGTGGNDGRLDFTNNFLQRLVELFDPVTGAPQGDAVSALEAALFGTAVPGLRGGAMGQYAPSDIGGPNATTGFVGGTIMNPWDFVLMLEGAVLFAASASRRLESAGGGRLAYPFTVRPTGVGNASTSLNDEGSSRGEIWMPLWTRTVSLAELRSLLSEGRAVLNGRPARDGLDFVRAVSKLGVDRGISEFVRYGFLMRNGKAYLASPLNRVKVRANAESELVDELDREQWLSRFQSASRPGSGTPARLVSLGRRLQDGLFRMAQGEGGRGARSTRVQEVLITLGEIQRYYASTQRGRESIPPIPTLRSRWVHAANDGSPEFLIAAALAGIHAVKRSTPARGGEGVEDALSAPPSGPGGVEPGPSMSGSAGEGDADPRRHGMRMASHFAPVPGEHWGRGWATESRDVVWHEGDLVRALLSVLERRLLRVEMDGTWEKPLSGTFGAPLRAVEAWLRSGDSFDARIARLLPGLALARVPAALDHPRRGAGDGPPQTSYALLKPFFVSERQLLRIGALRGAESGVPPAIPLPLALVRAIAADRDGWAGTDTGRRRGPMEDAFRRLRLAGLLLPGAGGEGAEEEPHVSPALRDLKVLGIPGPRLLAALLVPVSDSDLKRIVRRLFAPVRRAPLSVPDVEVVEEDVSPPTSIPE